MSIKEKLIPILFSLIVRIIKNMPKDNAKAFIDDILDILEQKIYESETKFDDKLVAPLISFVREVFSVPDDFNGDED